MKIFPASSSRSQPAPSAFSVGDLVMYENDNAPVLAAVSGFQRDRVSVVNEFEAEVALNRERLHSLPGTLPKEATTIKTRAAFLKGLHQRSKAAAAEFPIKELWGFVADDEREYLASELAESYYGRVDLDQYLTLRLCLIADKVFFKRKKDAFIPRPKDTVTEMEKAEEQRKKKLEQQTLFVETLQQKLRDHSVAIPPDAEPFIRLLEEVAGGAPHLDNNHQREAKELLGLCADRLRNGGRQLELPGNLEQAAYAVLEAVGIFGPATNIVLPRYRPRLTFSPAVLGEIDEIVVPASIDECVDKDVRRDCTSLEAFTIDDRSTKDMDDAISLEQTEDGFRLGIHISDVAALVRDGSRIDEEAKRRATSIYLPERTVPMLPPRLSEDRCSLVRGVPRLAFSCFFHFSRSYELLGEEVVPTMVNITERLDYDTVDTLLENGDPRFQVLFDITASLEQQRLEDGAYAVGKQDVIPVVDEAGNVTLMMIDEESPARSLVGELMVLVNAAYARFAASRSIPLIFRTQEQPDIDPDRAAGDVPPGPARDYAMRSVLKRSIASVVPGRHSSLALDAYAQISSPIRRYADLCNQRQLLHFIRHGVPFYTADSIRQIIDDLEEPLGLAMTISRESKRFWLLRYLQRTVKHGGTLNGIVVRTDLKTPLVEIEGLAIAFFAKFKATPQLGSHVTLKLSSIDPRYDYIRLEEA